MYPSQTSTIKYKAYNLGGVIANAIIAALSTLLMLPNNFYLLMMMIELVFVGAYKILVNLIPHKTNGVPNDGYIVKMLDAHIAMRKDYALYLRIYADTFLNKAISPSDYQYERKAGEISCEPEIKAEVTVFKEKVDETIEAIKKVHPYEEPVINVIPIWRTSF